MRIVLAVALLVVACGGGDDDGCPAQKPGDVPGSPTPLLPQPGSAAPLPAAIFDAVIWQAGDCYHVATSGTIDAGRITVYPTDGGLLRLASEVPPERPIALSFPERGCSGSVVIHAAEGMVESRGFLCAP